MTPTTREQVMEVIRNLPAETSVEEAMERLYFLADIEEGLRQVEHGEVISHEEAKRRLLGRSRLEETSARQGCTRGSERSGG